MSAGAARAFGDEAGAAGAALRKRAFKTCRDKLEKLTVLAKYQRFLSCVAELDTKTGGAVKHSANGAADGKGIGDRFSEASAVLHKMLPKGGGTEGPG